MSEGADNILSQMPPAEEIAVRAIDEMAASGYTSQLMRLRRPLLNELARQLITPGLSRVQVLEWLRSQPDADVDERAFYRFAQRWEETFKHSFGKISLQLLDAQITADAEQNGNLRKFLTGRAMRLIGQELVSVQTPAELNTGRLRAIMDALRSVERTEIEREELALRIAEGRRREQKLEADLAKLQLDIEQRRRKLQERVDAIKTEAQHAAEKSPAGTISREEVLRMIDSIMRGEAA